MWFVWEELGTRPRSIRDLKMSEITPRSHLLNQSLRTALHAQHTQHTRVVEKQEEEKDHKRSKASLAQVLLLLVNNDLHNKPRTHTHTSALHGMALPTSCKPFGMRGCSELPNNTSGNRCRRGIPIGAIRLVLREPAASRRQGGPPRLSSRGVL